MLEENKTCNQAKYIALAKELEIIHHIGIGSLTMYSDSKLVYKKVKGHW